MKKFNHVQYSGICDKTRRDTAIRMTNLETAHSNYLRKTPRL